MLPTHKDKHATTLDKCIVCGIERYVRPYRTGTMCKPCQDNSLRLKHSANYKGGQLRKDGRITIYFPEHPYCGKDKHIFRARLVVESHIGRYLLPSEEVHHINGILSDDNYDNLQILSHSEHAILTNKAFNKAQKMVEARTIPMLNEWDRISPPSEGQQARGKTLGYRNNYIHTYSRCQQCGKLRWFNSNRLSLKNNTGLCHKCSSTNTINRVNLQYNA